MPELPEVETVRRGLEPVMAGARIEAVEQRRSDLRFPFPDGFVSRLARRRIHSLGRRAKYLLVRLDSGEVLVMHLGMSGRFSIVAASDAAETGRVCTPGVFVQPTGCNPAHDHVVFHLSSGFRVVYNDPRRFGYMDLVAHDRLEQCVHFAHMGVEPLSNALSANGLAERAMARATDLKAFLLNQRNVAGLGNIYVCEALFRAGLSPRRRAGTLARADGGPTVRAERLVRHIRSVLEDAIAAGGSTLRDYARTDGSLGYFQHAFQVYGREGAACVAPGCRATIIRIVQSGRSTFYCPNCQR